MLQLLDVVEQGRKHASQRVWQVCVIEVHDRLSGGRVQAATLNDPAGDPYDCGMRGHRVNHHRAGTDPAVTADRDGAEHGRACADQHPVLDRGVAFPLLDAGSSQGHPLIQGHIVANLRRLTDDHAHTVVNEQAPADPSPGMDLDASPEAGPMAENACQRRQAVGPQPVSAAMKPHRVKPGVSEHYLPDRTHRRVALEYYPNLFFDLLPQHKQLPLARSRTGETGKGRSGELVFESPSR